MNVIAKRLLAWFPEKESVIVFERAANQQQRIYPDAADYGIFLDDNNRKTLRNALKSLIKFYGYTGFKWYGGQSWKIAIPIEVIDYNTNKYDCEILDISWSNDLRRKKEFLTIDISRKILSKDEIEKNYKKTGKGVKNNE